MSDDPHDLILGSAIVADPRTTAPRARPWWSRWPVPARSASSTSRSPPRRRRRPRRRRGAHRRALRDPPRRRGGGEWIRRPVAGRHDRGARRGHRPHARRRRPLGGDRPVATTGPGRGHVGHRCRARRARRRRRARGQGLGERRGHRRHRVVRAPPADPRPRRARVGAGAASGGTPPRRPWPPAPGASSWTASSPSCARATSPRPPGPPSAPWTAARPGSSPATGSSPAPTSRVATPPGERAVDRIVAQLGPDIRRDLVPVGQDASLAVDLASRFKTAGASSPPSAPRSPTTWPRPTPTNPLRPGGGIAAGHGIAVPDRPGPHDRGQRPRRLRRRGRRSWAIGPRSIRRSSR